MERFAYNQLLKWKANNNKKPLLITGVRQCGKTYLIKEFGKREYKEVAYFNFEGNDALKSVFDYDFNTSRIIHELESLILEKKINVENTLVVFDEIQDCMRAVQSLKYFCETMPKLNLIASGSLLGVALRKEGFSFPVGKVDRIEMYPMSFEEFVIADGGQKYIDGLKQYNLEKEIPIIYTVPMEKYLKNYYIVGGMPEVVQAWIETHDYSQVDIIQNNLIKDYSDDFVKHSTTENAVKMSQIWNSVPVQIAKDNGKFVFSHVKQGCRSKELEDSLQYLINAGLIYKLDMVANPEFPLSGMADTTFFKVYMSDIGLLRKKANLHYRTILDNDSAYISFKGAMAENYVLTQLKSLGIEAWFWKSKSDAELDFITDFNGRIVPIEVKSADNTKAKSMHNFCLRYEPSLAFKSSLKNVGDNTDGKTHIWSIPLYVFFRIKDYMAKG